MRPILSILIVALAWSLSANGQIRFEKGYFIDSNGVKTNCLIRNPGWSYSPLWIDYRITENGGMMRKEARDIAEFGFEGGSRYVGAVVEMDRSTDELDDNAIAGSFEPEWKSERILMKLLVDGSANLLVYREQGFERFFYQVAGEEPKQLIYKRYRRPGEMEYSYNRNFLNQLFVYVNCKRLDLVQMERSVDYSEKSLRKWFMDQVGCKGNVEQAIGLSQQPAQWFSARMLGGLEVASYKSGTPFTGTGIAESFGTNLALTSGVELEGLLNSENRKWAAVLEGNTVSYKGLGVSTGKKIEHYSINIQLGLRFYGFLNNQTKLAFTAGGTKDLNLSRIKPVMAAGLVWRRWMLESRWYWQKNAMANYFDRSVGSAFQHGSVVVKFAVF